jgi:probable phosphoglycerate mutase
VVRLWLVRHGETPWNADRRFQGWTDVPLNDRGRSQALELRERLSATRFTGVWSSDLSRARDTARLAHGDPIVDERLREIDFGDIEGDVWTDITPELRSRLVEFDGFCAPNGESAAHFRARVHEFLNELVDGDHLVVTHGGVVRMLVRDCGSDVFPGPGDLVVLDWTGRGVIDLGSRG